jgi:hypothetical protein
MAFPVVARAQFYARGGNPPATSRITIGEHAAETIL